MEDGLYHALPATGALGAMQLKASETWNPKVQRIGIKVKGRVRSTAFMPLFAKNMLKRLVDNVSFQ